MIDAHLMIAASFSEDLGKWASLQAALGYVAHEPSVSRSALVALNRSEAFGDFLRGTSDVGVCLDPDVEFTEQQLAAIVDAARQTRGIVGGCYSHDCSLYNFAPKGAHSTPRSRIEAHEFMIGPSSPQGLTEVDACGTGFMAIHRDVAPSILETFPELRTPREAMGAYWFRERALPIEGGAHFLPEDYSFCSYVRDAGHNVHILPSVALTHKNEPWWSPLDHEPSSGFHKIRMNVVGVL